MIEMKRPEFPGRKAYRRLARIFSARLNKSETVESFLQGNIEEKWLFVNFIIIYFFYI